MIIKAIGFYQAEIRKSRCTSKPPEQRSTIVAIGDEVTLRVVGRYQSQNIVNNLTYEIIAQTSAENRVLNSLVGAWDAMVKAAWLLRHIDTYTLVGTKAFNKVGDAKTPSFDTIQEAGGVVGIEVPSPVCRTITLYTESDNFRRRGRVMLSGCDTVMFNVSDGAVTVAEQTALDILGAVLLASIQLDEDSFQPILGSTAVLPKEQITDFKSRPTPSLISSRRIRQFLIG